MKSTKLEQLERTVPRNSQQGFTLIELLVVVSILGILAAVVTMSLVGVETHAKQQAQAAELSTVQTAFDTDVQENGLDGRAACQALGGGLQVSQMTSWPGPGAAALFPNYLHQQSTSQFTYTCRDVNSATLGN